jgi:creatinine amidohydrolase
VAAASYWTLAWDALVAAGAAEAGRFPGHAGAFETAVMLALWPALVTEPRAPHSTGQAVERRGMLAPYRAEHHGSWQRIDGYTDSPDQAQAEQGRRYLDAIIPVVGRAFVEFYQASRQVLP